MRRQIVELARRYDGGAVTVRYAVREYRRGGRRPLERTVTVERGAAWCAGCASAGCSHARYALVHAATGGAA